MMNTLQLLTLRRTSALGKLATLERRAERLPHPAAATVSAALAELRSALEHILIATERLQQQTTELAEARDEITALSNRLEEYCDLVPTPCLWTTPDGEIRAANPAAAECLNVSAARLTGRPFFLFLAERAQFMDALSSLKVGGCDVVELSATVRPREMRPRSARLIGRRLVHDERRCWFILQA